MKLPRIMVAAPASGSGKTMLTLGMLQVWKNRGINAAAFKCGPDYIDPMFHQKVIGKKSKNLDTFFTGMDLTRWLFGKEAGHADISILEGVMGFYDGAGGVTTAASSYELAKATDTPVILVVNVKGMSLSVVPLIRGFLEYHRDSRIEGVILNQITAMTYQMLKKKIQEDLGIRVMGYLPGCPELAIESRHLGLVTPGEIQDLKEKLQTLAGMLEETLDWEQIAACAAGAPELEYEQPKLPALPKERGKAAPRIGVARDEAFCFFYQDNLELMEIMGAELVYFSPLHDRRLPPDLDGLILYGGYPELYAEKLCENHSMRKEIKTCIEAGLPYLAECGGFIYLHEQMEDMEGNWYDMAGVIEGQAYRTEKLNRFGYIRLGTKREDQLLEAGAEIKAHEFHYFDSTSNGTDYHARKPVGKREWDCIHGGRCYAAGFPHLYYYSNPEFIFRFLQQCQERRI